MANPRFPYLVVLKDHGADLDITKHVISGTQYEETGNEEISNAKILLNAHFGRFIEDAKVIGGVTFPRILHFDRIFIRFTDPDGTVLEDVIEVRFIIPHQTKNQGVVLEILGDNQGWHFFQQHNLKQYQRESGFDVIKDQGDVYNTTRGPSQPIIEQHDQVFVLGTGLGNAASAATAVDFDFSNSEFYFGDAVNETLDWLGAPVSAGGELEFFDWRFIPKYNHAADTDIDKIQLSLRVSGDVASKIVLDKTLTPKMLEIHGSLDHEQGTAVYAYGDPNAGSLPTSFSRYFGEKEFFNSAKDWTDGRVYKNEMRVQEAGVTYEAVQDHTASDPSNKPPNATFWTVKTFAPGFDYSFWTESKPQYWINSGAGYIDQQVHPSTGRACQHDANLVIRDGNHRRTYVDIQADNPDVDIPSYLFLEGGGNEMYRGFRIRVTGTPGAGPLTDNSGNDRTGKTYTDAIVQHNGAVFTGSVEYKNWDVFEAAVNDLECTDLQTGKCFTFNPAVLGIFQGTAIGGRQGGWQEGGYGPDFIPGSGFGALWINNLIFDCLHDYNIISGTPNQPDFGSAQGIEAGSEGANSAVRVKYNMSVGGRTNGFWLNWAFPGPISGFGGFFTAETVGEEYKPATLDFNNMHLSAKNERGLNQGLDARNRGSEDYGKIGANRFYLKLIGKNAGGFDILQGNIKVRVAYFDTSDNVIIGDAVVNELNNYMEITVDTGSLKIYRGRSGFPFLPVQELEILDIFATRNVKRMAIFSADSYDKEGRYLAINRFNVELFGSVEANLDGFHFVKPITATTQEEAVQASRPARNLELPPKNYPHISNYKQLKNTVQSQLEIDRFERVEYKIRRGMLLNIRFGEEFTLKHSELVFDTDTAPNNEVDLVCKKNIITINKGRATGGFLVTTIGVKRIRV